MPETVLSSLVDALRKAAVVNHADRVAPVAVLWPDPSRAWEPLLPLLREQVPILTLGPWNEERASGPSLWIRCVVGGELRPSPRSGQPWVVWLPDVRRDDLRAVDEAPTRLRALAELQYRADWWTQRDRSAWTPSAWLGSQNGLGLDLGRDQATRDALALSLPELFTLPVESARRRGRLDADYLMALVSRDEVRTLLLWINDPDGTRASLAPQQWQAFVAQCRREFGVNLLEDGPLTVAERLGTAEAPWDRVWDRFAESPAQYERIPEVLRRAKTQLLQDASRWPQDNDDAETELRRQLTQLNGLQPAEARARVADLEAEHAPRRETVWGRLGQSPLAHALGSLTGLAQRTQVLPYGDTAAGYETWYVQGGYAVDELAVAALAAVRGADRDAVAGAVRTLYYQWLDATTRRYQEAVRSDGYAPTLGLQVQPGDCVVFVDGLRFDVGEALRAVLVRRAVAVTSKHRTAPLPSVTTTGKAALLPFAAEVSADDGFDLVYAGRALQAKEALGKHGFVVLGPGESARTGDRGWTEQADIDRTGHNLGLALAERIEGQVADIASRVQDLLAGGWQRVVVATDHGWLLMPGALNRQELPESRADVRKPRAARLKAGVDDGGYPVLPHAYDPDIRIVSPHGIAAFHAGQVYDHGGLSLQECVIPLLVATQDAAAGPDARITSVSWVGLRCRVQLEAAPTGASVDLRRSPGDPATSVVTKLKAVEGDDEAALLVADDTLQDVQAYAVLLSDAGDILSQMVTKVGG